MSLIPTLYLTRNGLLEPLGQSQVLAYLRELSRVYQITLISYEKDEDWADSEKVARQRDECESLGILWLPQRFRPRPKIVAPALSMIRMVWLVGREARRQRVGLIHARSYIPAAAALVVGRLTGVPFIFDMRALWPEELITAGRLRRGSLLHCKISMAERACLHHAAAVVSLTHGAMRHLRQVYPEALDGQRVSVIPTCADLKRFLPTTTPAARQGAGAVHGCIGTILSGWFRDDWLAAWWATAAEAEADARFEIITRDDPDAVRDRIDPGRRLGMTRLTIRAEHPQAMPKAVQGHDVSVMFFTDGLSKLGSSPTRMGEALGSGIPVVTNEGVGDVAEIVRKYRVGVLVKGSSPAHMREAWKDLEALQKEPDLPARCRRAAEEVFSLEAGTAEYARLYEDVLTKNKRCVV